MPPSQPLAGLQAVYIANKDALLRFLRVRGAGDEAEDLLQELWIRIGAAEHRPISAPLAYLYRAANSLMIDRHRSLRQANLRDADWAGIAQGPAGSSDDPSPDRSIAARQAAALVAETLDELQPHPRVRDVFRLYRVEGVGQRAIAERLGVSLSTVESDLRKAYRALAALKERIDEV